ncbi:hypothetical protein L210DRAFT_3637304 [Boletus edulis BED1]|uniref:Uncharacterized protein n=1 Tax=Boletus edulis BED1 TaxID=1328754 RepID=A0AAD4BAY0_BOLED|nr:hypothetical protein L210DRAFT_3637304 [Boletus edulis BED1]
MSRAIVVHPATLEALDTSGCGDDFIAQGPDQRNYLLQEAREPGAVVHRPLRVVGLRRNASNPQLCGRVIMSTYVIGADSVRTMAGIGLTDPTNAKGQTDNNLAIADVTFDTADADQNIICSSHFRERTAIADVVFTRLGSGELGQGGVILIVMLLTSIPLWVGKE